MEEASVSVVGYQLSASAQREERFRLVYPCREEWQEIDLTPFFCEAGRYEVEARLCWDALPFALATKPVVLEEVETTAHFVLPEGEGRTLAPGEEMVVKAPLEAMLYGRFHAPGHGFTSRDLRGAKLHRPLGPVYAEEERALGIASRGGEVVMTAGKEALEITSLFWRKLEGDDFAILSSTSTSEGQRQVVFNNDGFSEGWIEQQWDVAQLKDQVTRYQDRGIAALHWCSLVSDVASYRSRFVDFLGDHLTGPWPAERFEVARRHYEEVEHRFGGLFTYLHSLGNEIGLPVWGSLRMNAFYGFHPFGVCLNGRFWFDHPSYRIQWTPQVQDNPETPLSFAWPEVQERRIGVLVEMAEAGCEGVHLDFCRYPRIIGYDAPALELFEARYGVDGRTVPLEDARWVGVRQEILNGMMERLRLRLDEVGRHRGRRVEIAVRLPATQWASFGFDPQTWVRQRWVDLLIPAFPGHDRWFDLEPWAEWVRGTPVKLLAGMEYFRYETAPTELTDAEVKSGQRPGTRIAHDRESLLHRVADFYRKGADGIYLFNAWDQVALAEKLDDPRWVEVWQRLEDPQRLTNLPRL